MSVTVRYYITFFFKNQVFVSVQPKQDYFSSSFQIRYLLYLSKSEYQQVMKYYYLFINKRADYSLPCNLPYSGSVISRMQVQLISLPIKQQHLQYLLVQYHHKSVSEKYHLLSSLHRNFGFLYL